MDDKEPEDSLVFEFDTTDDEPAIEDTTTTVETSDEDEPNEEPDQEEDDTDEADEADPDALEAQEKAPEEKFGNRAEKRIKQLLSRVKDAESAAASHMERVAQLEADNQKIETRSRSSQEAAVREHAQRLDANIAAANAAYRKAREDGDIDAEVDANDKMLTYRSEKFVVDQVIRKIDHGKANPAEKAKDSQPRTTQNEAHEPSARALKWQKTNAWFGDDKVRTAAAIAVHTELMENGIRPDIDEEEYYESLDKELGKAFNMKTVKAKKSPVAGGKRTTGAPAGSKTRVTLSKAELGVAKQLGVTPEAYAKQKLDVQNERG